MASSHKTIEQKSWGELLQSILPEDPTGQLQKLRDFVVENFDIMKWMALTVLTVQVKSSALHLNLAMRILERQSIRALKL